MLDAVHGGHSIFDTSDVPPTDTQANLDTIPIVAKQDDQAMLQGTTWLLSGNEEDIAALQALVDGGANTTTAQIDLMLKERGVNFAPRIGVAEDKDHHLGQMQGAYINTEPYDPRVHPRYQRADAKQDGGYADAMNLYLADAVRQPSPLAIGVAQAVLSEVTPRLVALLSEMGEPLTMEHTQKPIGNNAAVLNIELDGGTKSLANGVLEKLGPSHRLSACLRATGHNSLSQQGIMKAIYLLSTSELMPWCTALAAKTGGRTPSWAPPGYVNYTYSCRDVDLSLA